MIDVHYWPTPNGKKVTIALEECGVEYRVVPCSIGTGDQFTDEFLDISPNNRMPAIVDQNPPGGGEPVPVFESGACLMYIAEVSGKFCPEDLKGKYDVYQWIVWQMANQGPKFGELGHFRRLEDREGDQSYAIRRFDDEVNRLFGVMNNRLYDRRYLAGNDYTVADMACYPWAVRCEELGQKLEEFPYFRRWLEELGERPALQKGMAVGSDWGYQSYEEMSEEELNNLREMLYNQRARPAPEGGLL